MERYWVARGRRLALRVNAGWWLHYLLPALLGISVLGSIAILIARRNGWSLHPIAIAVMGSAVIAAIAALVLARRRFFSLSDAFARLDLTLGLFNGLSSAALGVGRWPEPRPVDRIRWRVARFSPLLASIAMMGAALSIPMEQEQAKPKIDQSEPIAWTEIEEIVGELAKEEVIETESLEDWKKRLEELREQPEEQWFEHASLEAGDHLRDQLDGAMSKLQQDLSRAEQLLEQMRSSDPATSDSNGLDRAWKQAMKDLELGNLRLDPELSKQLAELDPSEVRELTPEELAKLKKALEKGVKTVELAKGENGDEAGDLTALVAAQAADGRGGVGRGRGDAELSLRPDPTDASATESQNLANEDLTHAALGDLVGLSPKEHEIDPTQYRGPTAGGRTSAKAGGGEAVWKSSLPPNEQDFLERYFR